MFSTFVIAYCVKLRPKHMKIESIHLTSIGLQSPDYEIIEKYLSNVKSAFFMNKSSKSQSEIGAAVLLCCRHLALETMFVYCQCYIGSGIMYTIFQKNRNRT